MTYEEKMQHLRNLRTLQSEMSNKAGYYKARDIVELSSRFERASYAAMNAVAFIQAALMAEREISVAREDL